MLSTLQIEALERMVQQRKMLGLDVADVYTLIEKIREFLKENANA